MTRSIFCLLFVAFSATISMAQEWKKPLKAYVETWSKMGSAMARTKDADAVEKSVAILDEFWKEQVEAKSKVLDSIKACDGLELIDGLKAFSSVVRSVQFELARQFASLPKATKDRFLATKESNVMKELHRVQFARVALTIGRMQSLETASKSYQLKHLGEKIPAINVLADFLEGGEDDLLDAWDQPMTFEYRKSGKDGIERIVFSTKNPDTGDKIEWPKLDAKPK